MRGGTGMLGIDRFYLNLIHENAVVLEEGVLIDLGNASYLRLIGLNAESDG